MKKTLILIVTILLICMFILLSFNTGWGASDKDNKKAGVAIVPTSYELQAKPGERFRKEIRVTNVTGHTVSVSIEADDLVSGNEAGTPKILTGKKKSEPKLSIKDWVTFSESKITLDPQEEKIVYYTVEIPKKATPGGRYGAIRFYSSDNVSRSIWQSIYLIVKGPARKTGKVKEFFTYVTLSDHQVQTTFFDSGPVGFTARFENTGDTHYIPVGTLSIDSFTGYRKSFPIKTSVVLPSSVRRFQADWQDVPFLGIYKAQVLMQTPEKTVRSPQITFIVIPWKTPLAILLILVSFGLIYVIARRILNRPVKTEKQAKKKSKPQVAKK